MKKNKVALIVNSVLVITIYLIITILYKINIINKYHEAIIIGTCINIIVASSINLVVGYLGQLALGHAGFMAVGAYSAAIFAKAVKFPNLTEFIVGLLIAGVVTGIIGVLIGIPVLRLKGDYLAIVTLGFGEIIRVIILNLKITGGGVGLTAIPKYTNFNTVYVCTVIIMSFLFLFLNSRHGRAILSIKEDEIAAESMGIDTTFYKVFGFTISAMVAGIGGALLAFNQRVLDPNKFTFMYSMEFFIIVVIGGMGSLSGTIITAIVLSLINQLLYEYEKIRLIIYAVVIILMIIFKPQGIFGTREISLYDLLFGKKNKK